MDDEILRLNNIESLNPLNSVDSFDKFNKKDSKNIADFAKHFKGFIINELDIEDQIKKLKKLDCCINNYLEEMMKTQNGFFQLLEIRKRNITINMGTTRMNKIKIKSNKKLNRRRGRKYHVCEYCKEHCLSNIVCETNEINFNETNTKICACAYENHDILHLESKYNLTSNEKEEIKKIIDKYNEITLSGLLDEKIRKRIEEFIQKKDDNKKLAIISYMLNRDINVFFKKLTYEDEIFENILSCLKNYKEEDLVFDNIMSFYCKNYLFNNLNDNEQPVFIFNYEFSKIDNLPALYYGNPNILSQSFFFQIYRKNIILKNIESLEVMKFLKKLDMDNNFISSHLLNSDEIPPQIFSFGLFSLDTILEKYKNKGKFLSKFRQDLSSNIIYIFINQLCEIFSDFITNVSTNHISLLNKENPFSKFLVEKLFDSLYYIITPKDKSGLTFKNVLINYHLYNFRFFEENKERILTVLSSYAFDKLKKNIFDGKEKYDEIFDFIEQKIETIIKKKKLKKNNSEQNIVIVKKLLDLYKLKYDYNIDEFYEYDFSELLQNIVAKDYPVKLIKEVLDILNKKSNKSLNDYLDYTLKITLLCLSNIIGGAYIFNSNFIPKLIQVIQKLNFRAYSNFILEMLIILKISFNRKIVDISFLRMKIEKNIENDEKSEAAKEYIIDILFRSDPLLSNESFYYFNNFNKLLDRIKTTYSTFFEIKKTHIIPQSFENIKYEDSYLNIIKTIGLNMIEELPEWKSERNSMTLDKFNDEDLLNENEKKIEKKINEEIKKVDSKFPGFILLDFIRCLENLSQTNFYLKYEEESLFNDSKYDLFSIIVNKKLPLAIKSKLLNFLLKYALCLKFDPNTNKIYGPLITTTRFEKEPSENLVKGKYLITLESKESEKHVNETVKLMYIFIKCIELLEQQQNSLNFEEAYIEKNGLYDFCVSIILSIHYFSNLIVNKNKIHELYLIYFSQLAVKFLKNEELFMKIINKKIEHKEIDFKITEKFHKKISNIVEMNKKIQKYIDKINSDSYNFSQRKPYNIYQTYKDYYEGNLSCLTNNHYSSIIENNRPKVKITLKELNDFNGIDPAINKKILDNYNKWCDYIKEEFDNIKRIKELFHYFFNLKKRSISKRELFYSNIFIHIVDYKSEGEYILNDSLFLKTLIRIIRTDDEEFIKVCDDQKMEMNIKNTIDIEINEFKARIIGQIIRKINYLANYELLISQCFSNTEQENNLSELLNCLILFLEILGEHFNKFFHDAIFKYKFDLSMNKTNFPAAKYDDESKTFKKLIEDVDENNIFSPYEVLLNLHQKTFETLYISNDVNYRETQQNNLLILFNSLTCCIIEFSNFDNEVYGEIMTNLYNKYFFWKKEDESFNPIFKSLNFEIDNKILEKEKEKYIFTVNNILTLFIFYIRYGPKEMNNNYFYEIRNYTSYTTNLYVFHTYQYTKQIVDYLDKDLLNRKNCIEDLKELYKKGNIQSFQAFVLAKKYYELLFILKKYYGYIELNSILPDYNGKIESNNIIEQFTDSSIYDSLINIITNDDNPANIDENRAVVRGYSKTMDVIFDFWRQIFNDIEISLGDEKKTIYFISRPLSLYLSNDEKMYFEDNIDRSSRDSKLISIYDNIDSFIFEMIYNSKTNKFNLAQIFYYEQLELINIILFVIHNIILIIHYYKSWKEDYSIYNEIETNKTSKILLILCGVHILYILIVIVNWFRNRLTIEYFHDLTEYTNNNLETQYKFTVKNIAYEFRKLIKNPSTNFSDIKKFFPAQIETSKRIYILLFHTILFNPKLLPFIFSLICLIFYYLFSQIFLIIPLILVANLVPTLSAIFKGLLDKFKYLIFLYSYTLIVLYIFSWIGFLFLPNLFRFEVVDKYNENIADENDEPIEEYICSSSIQCILYFINFGLSSGGALDLNLISFKNTYGYYLRQFFFDIFFFLFINMIFSNVFLALITDAVGEMTEKAMDNENDRNNVCFICDLNQSDCINQNIDFDRHIQEHSKWKYINFMYKIIIEEEVEFDQEEYDIWKLIKKRNIDWFPCKKKTNDE